MKKMNKSDLAEFIARNNNIEVSKATSMMNVVIGNIEKALVKGHEVNIMGFGSFKVKDVKARTGRDPRNPEKTIEIPATKAVKFKESIVLKRAVIEGGK